MARHSSSVQIDLKRHCFYSLLKAEIFTAAAQLKAVACLPSEVGSQAGPCAEGVNNIHGLRWMSCMDPFQVPI